MLQSRGGGTSLATAVLEDEVLAEQGEEASLLSGCRALLRSVTKVSSRGGITGSLVCHKDIKSEIKVRTEGVI